MSRKGSGVPLQLQIDRWDRLPWTQRVECPVESGLTPPKRMSDEAPAEYELRAGEALDFHDA